MQLVSTLGGRDGQATAAEALVAVIVEGVRAGKAGCVKSVCEVCELFFHGPREKAAREAIVALFRATLAWPALCQPLPSPQCKVAGRQQEAEALARELQGAKKELESLAATVSAGAGFGAGGRG